MPSAITLATLQAPGFSMVLPPLIAAGDAAAQHTLEFFTARIPNAHTREAYGRAVFRFCAWCDEQGVKLEAITSPVVAAYLQVLLATLSVPSAKLHLSALRHWLDWLTERGVLTVNPAAAVRGPRYAAHEGKTPVLERDEARRLLDALDGEDLVSLRDRALIAIMLFGFVRVGAVVAMRVRDFADEGGDAWLVLREKGGKARRIPAHHLVRTYVRAYLARAELAPRSKGPLFQTAPRQGGVLSGKAMQRGDVSAGSCRRRSPSCRAAVSAFSAASASLRSSAPETRILSSHPSCPHA